MSTPTAIPRISQPVDFGDSTISTDPSHSTSTTSLSQTLGRSPYPTVSLSSDMSVDILRSLSKTGVDKPNAKKMDKKALHLSHLPERTIQPSFPRTPGSVDPDNPPWPAFRGYHTYSFANATMGVRLPTILSKAIQDVLATLNTLSSEDLIKDLLECVKRMEGLKAEMEGNGTLRPIKDDGEADVALWNKEIAKYFLGKDFMNATWLFAEAYKYRRLRECFTVSKHWHDYDVFFRQKCDTFSRSTDAVFELCTRFAEPFKHMSDKSELEKLEAERLMFVELTQICLWGNSTDLSLLINMTEEQIKSLQSTGGDALAETEKNILGNHIPQVWNLVSKLKKKMGENGKKGGRIDFILDNAGFELYCDCVYADFLIQCGFASEIRFHGKRYPWFVSDVTTKDWEWLLNTMVYGHLFPEADAAERESLRSLGQRWKEYERQGIWTYEQHPFWCTGYTFWDLQSEAPDLFLNLSKSDLVIFKGDLNHRKLTYDCAAPASTPFSVAIGPMALSAGAPPVCSIRTIKSDVVVGLGDNGDDIARKLDKDEDGWKISGKYAVILLSEGRPGEKVQFA